MTERNNALLARVDERTESILRELQAINERHKETNEHLVKLNGQTTKNTTSCGKNRSHINIQWWFIAGIFLLLLLGGLKLEGVF